MTKSEVAPLVGGTARLRDRLAWFNVPNFQARTDRAAAPAGSYINRLKSSGPRPANRGASLWPRNCQKEELLGLALHPKRSPAGPQKTKKMGKRTRRSPWRLHEVWKNPISEPVGGHSSDRMRARPSRVFLGALTTCPPTEYSLSLPLSACAARKISTARAGRCSW
jgi:hypothetical protein